MIARQSAPTMVLVRPNAVRRLAVLGALLAAGPVATGALVACGSHPPSPAGAASGDPTPTAAPTAAARAQLAARAAAAQDRHMLAFYTLTAVDQPPRTVTVVRADDDTWRVDIAGGALGGAVDVSIIETRAGLFQCALPTLDRLVTGSCVRVADPGGRISAAYDPRVQHPFTDWLDVLTDPRVAVAVSTVTPLRGTSGTCYTVESTSTSLSAPLDVGVYCFADDGTLTGAKVSFGTLTLAGTPSEAPPTVSLPAPVVAGDPVPTAAPPSPTASTGVGG
ncbi:MAG TPA: hypothetical protein VGJ53_09940 [Micromonosporaceae bacterium]